MKPADELRKFFLDELKGLGVPLVKLRFSGNAELYSVESGSSGIVYLKVSRPEGKKIFWGLRKDFLDFLLGKKETSVSVLEFFIAVLKRDRGGTELPPAPEGQIPAHLRRWLLESEKKPWIVILLEGQPSVKHVMGYVLAPDHIRSAVNQKIWRDYSKDGSEWKVHEDLTCPPF